MAWSVVLVVIAAVLAAIAVVAAVMAQRAVAEMRELRPEPTPSPAEPDVFAPEAGVSLQKRQAQRDWAEVEYEVIEGRVIVPATQEQAVSAVLSQPRIRAAIWVAGLAHALRPESRDRIVGLVRREARTRRRARQRAARAAARTVVNP